MNVQRRVGPYLLVRKLGEGGMGIVYLAQDPASAPVALKVLRPELAGREDFRRRFTREAEAARQVARFCTAPVLDAGFDDGTAYLVTEYVEGPDLSALVETRGPMRGANLEALAVGVATALAAIHQAGVVHRDLKPSNILLSAVGPRVIDFGIARLAEPDATQSAAVVGTPAYMAPEQAGGGPITAASDVFAWGGVVTYAGTGRPPFGTGQVPEVLYRVAHHVPRLDGLDERLRVLVEQALRKEPARRPTAQQLLDRLLGREHATVSWATRAVSDAWTPPAAPEPPVAPPGSPPTTAPGQAPATPPGTLSAPGRTVAGQAGPGQAGSGQAGSGQAGSGQAGPGQAGSGQTGSGQGGRWVAPAVAAVLASVLTMGGALALWRPWQGSGTAAVTRTVYETVTSVPDSPAADATASDPTGSDPAGSGPTGSDPADSGSDPGSEAEETSASQARTDPPATVTPGSKQAAVSKEINNGWSTFPAVIRISSLRRQGENVRLEFTLKNNHSQTSLGLYGLTESNSSNLGDIEMVLPGRPLPVKPLWENDQCACSGMRPGDFIPAGQERRLFAVFRGVPENVTTVDLDMKNLGHFANLLITKR
ncbi:serine/threonine-protein kinase [Nonomuraea candida]|uniref:serine/threonine-protein kinase n=1 Tax=Nonomuraea candida TaxID=359159 RepID=UPI000693E8C3|nr:serine/threonine-protein kinase [Nonomuraea candida]